MAERMVKCYGRDCEVTGIKHPSSKMRKISGKNFCPDCYAKEIENRRQRDKLYEYICEVYKTPFVTPLIKKHINDFIANGLTYKKDKEIKKAAIEIQENVEKIKEKVEKVNKELKRDG